MALFSNDPKLSLDDIENGLDELVAVYLQKYEQSLEHQREEVQSQIDDTLARLKEHDELVIDSVNVEQYAHTSEVLGIRSRIAGTRIEWDEYESNVVVTLMLEDLDDVTGSMRTLGKYKRVPINQTYYGNRKLIKSTLDDLNKQKSELRPSANKANEIRTKLIEIRLRDTELADLVDHEEVNALIQ